MMTARAVLSIFCVTSFSVGLAAVVEVTSPGDVLLQESSTSNAGVCTGEGAPRAQVDSCYAGTKLGEAVTMKMDSFDPEQNTGSLLVQGSGMSPMKCSRDFAKSGQFVTVTDFQHCLPSTVKAHGMRYCSDQDHIILDAGVGPMSVEMLLRPSPCPSVLLQQEESTDNDILSHSAWVWDSEECTGVADPPAAHSPFCFTGSKMGEVVSIKVNSFDSKSALGSVGITGSGLTGIKCVKSFNKAQQLINVPQLERCLPKTVKPTNMRYCSDQNKVLLDASVGILPVQLVLIPAPCPAVLLQTDAQASSLLQSDSQWPWESTTCTGVKDPIAMTEAPTCYSGKKMGETVTIKVHSFDTPSSSGSVFVSGSGLAKIKCERSFLKAQQMITVTKLDECLPSTVSPSGLKYCSDQDKVILDATVAKIPVEMVLTPTACPAAFLEESEPGLTQGEIFASGASRVMRNAK